MDFGVNFSRAGNQFAFNKRTGFARVATGDNSGITPGSFGEVPGERASNDPYGSRIERELAGLAANAIGAEKPSCVFRLQFVSQDFGFESPTGTIVTCTFTVSSTAPF